MNNSNYNLQNTPSPRQQLDKAVANKKKQTVEELENELQQLRADAERYRCLRKQNWDSSKLFVVAGGVKGVHLGVDCPTLDRLDDAVDKLLAQQSEKSETVPAKEIKHPPEPTPEQCTKNERLADFDGLPAFAVWYPQMGGYVGKAVVVIAQDGSCFETYVWHDGEFPFSSNDPETRHHGPVRHLHHCDAGQFVNFGNNVAEFQDEVEENG